MVIKGSDKMANEIMDKEIERLIPFFEDVAPDKKALAYDLINQAGFMKSVLYELQQDISNGGTVDEYSNGANQSGLKISASMQAYNSMIKNYIAVNKQLAALLPKENKSNENPVDLLSELMGDD